MTQRSPLATIERTNAVLGVALTAAAGLAGGPRAMLAAGVGAALGCANFVAIRRLASGAVADALDGAAGPGRALALTAALLAKMGLLFGLVWAALRFGHLEVLPFTAGLCVFVPSCLGVGLVTGGRARADGVEA